MEGGGQNQRTQSKCHSLLVSSSPPSLSLSFFLLFLPKKGVQWKKGGGAVTEEEKKILSSTTHGIVLHWVQWNLGIFLWFAMLLVPNTACKFQKTED